MPAKAEEAEEPIPPTPERVARRALVMSAVVCRAFLERDAGNEEVEELRKRLDRWLRDLGIADELEEWEAELLRKPLGALQSRESIDASWLSEGLAVLAWAMGRYELPGYDESVDPQDVTGSLLFLQDEARELLRVPRLRPAAEIEAFQNTVFSLHWRLRQYQLAPAPMNFEEFARTAWFGPLSLDGLRLAENDLAIGALPISVAPEAELSHCHSVAQERHRAANWLMGHDEVYSQVDTST